MNQTKPDDIDLIRQARSGDDEAFGKLVLRYTHLLYKVINRVSCDSLEAEATVQEAFLRVWKNLYRYSEDRPFFPYLVTIAININRDQWRKTSRLEFDNLDLIIDNLPDSKPAPEEQVEHAQILEALAKAVTHLPSAYRAVIALRYDADMSYQEIANSLDIPINTVRTRLRRAKIHLRQFLEDQE